MLKQRFLRGIIMLSQKDNILQFNQNMKSDKMPYIIYSELESLIKKVDECANNPEKSSTIKVVKQIPCGYSISTIWAFGNIESKQFIL